MTAGLVISGVIQFGFLLRSDNTARLAANAADLSARAAVAIELPMIRVDPDNGSFGVRQEFGVRLAAEIAAKSPLAIWGTKEILNDFDRRRLEDGLRYVAAWNSGMFMPEDVLASIAAAKRKQSASYRDLMPTDAPAIPRKKNPTKG